MTSQLQGGGGGMAVSILCQQALPLPSPPPSFPTPPRFFARSHPLVFLLFP